MSHVAKLHGDHGKFWRALILALHAKRPNALPPNEAIAVMEILQAGLDSAAREETVRI